MSQSQMILEHLRTHGSITQQEAVELFGCYRLGARIYDLKAAGHKISSVIREGVNRFGARTRYAYYTLHNGGESNG